MQRLLLIGLNHTTAPLDVREKLAFAPTRSLAAVAELRQHIEGGEVVILSTCNRVELYLGAPEEITREQVVTFLRTFHNLPDDSFASHLYEMRGRAVIEHLFAVSSSLDSMVLGETQIIGQVRDAYEAARTAGATGPLLNPLFQRAVGVGKEVLSQTHLAEGRVSVASVAVDYASRIFDTFSDKTVLCMGTGKMSQLVLRQFVGLKPKQLLIASRNLDRARSVAEQFGGTGVSSLDLDQLLIQADIVVSSTGHPQTLITRPRFESLLRPRRYRPIFMIDIAVPRDIEPAVGEIEGVYLYNLDDLQEVVTRTIDSRSESVVGARTIVNKQVDAFLAWNRQREIGPMIDAMYKRYTDIARAELERTAGKMQLDEQQRKLMDELVHRIVQKMLHDPISQLRAPEHHENTQTYVHAIEKLFKLEPPRDNER